MTQFNIVWMIQDKDDVTLLNIIWMIEDKDDVTQLNIVWMIEDKDDLTQLNIVWMFEDKYDVTQLNIVWMIEDKDDLTWFYIVWMIENKNDLTSFSIDGVSATMTQPNIDGVDDGGQRSPDLNGGHLCPHKMVNVDSVSPVYSIHIVILISTNTNSQFTSLPSRIQPLACGTCKAFTSKSSKVIFIKQLWGKMRLGHPLFQHVGITSYLLCLSAQ